MRKILLSLLTTTAIVCVTLLSSCIDENYTLDAISTDIGLDMTLVAPLAHSTIPLTELIPDDFDDYQVIIEDDKIFFSYEEERNLGNEIVDHIKMVPEGDYTFYLPPLVSGPSSGTIDMTEELVFDGINTNPNERLDSILLKGSIIPLTIITADDWIAPSYLELSFNNDQLLLDDTLYPGNKVVVPLVKGQTTLNIDIASSVLNLSGSDRIEVNLKAVLETDPLSPISGSDIVVNLSYDHLDPHLTYCHLGPARALFDTEQNIDMDFFAQLDDVFFPFYNPEFYIIAEDNIGLPVDYHIEYVKASNPKTHEVVYADFHGSRSTVFELAYPTYEPIAGLSHHELLNFDTQTLLETSSFLLDRANGATNRLFQIDVKQLSYKYSIWPRVTPPDDVHYFFQESDIRLKLRYQFQWYFEGNETDPEKNFRVASRDTLGIEMSPIFTDPLQIDDDFLAQIKLNYINHLPIGANASLRFLDAGGNEILTELAQDFLIAAGEVDENGVAIDTQDPAAQLYIRMNYDQFTIFTEDVKQIAFTYAIGNEKLKDIQFRASDWLDLTASMYANGEIEIDITNAN